MPQELLEPQTTYRRKLHDVALENYGYVTTRMAAGLGIPVVELGKLSARHKFSSIPALTKLAYGLYRFDDIPITSRDQFMEAVLRVGPDAYLVGDAVLALHDLALVNPRRIRVGTPRRLRPNLPDSIEMVLMPLPPEDLTNYEGIPSATVARALLDCRATVMQDRLLAAAHKAREEGLLRRGEVDRVLAELEKPL